MAKKQMLYCRDRSAENSAQNHLKAVGVPSDRGLQFSDSLGRHVVQDAQTFDAWARCHILALGKKHAGALPEQPPVPR